MEKEINLSKSKKEIRIVLTPEAAIASEAMVARLKEVMPTVKLTPSSFVSFLVQDYFATHFEKDKDIIIAEFFDSDAYFEAARKKARGSAKYEELMAKALAEAKVIKAKKRRRTESKVISSTQESENTAS